MSESAAPEHTSVTSAAPEPEERPSFSRGAAGAAVYEVAAYALRIVIRLGSNLVLTRLLVPEAFGLMAMLNTIAFMLWMLSEVGLSQAVTMSPNGEDPLFLDTVYSLQAGRGVVLWVAASALAWPMSLYFSAPDLVWIVPIGSFGAVLHGFSSTRVHTLRRRVRPKAILTLELASAIVCLIVNVAGAYMGFGVKILVATTVLNSAIFLVGSHLLPGASDRNRLRSSADFRHEIMHFGRWIFFSSLLTAVAQRGDQVLLGRLMGASGLGIYNIALALAEMPEALIGNVVNGAIYPTLARVRNTQPEAFADVYYKLRRWLDPLAHIGLGGLIGMSDWLIDLMYDDRYQSAGWMLRVLAARTSVQILASLVESCFVAHGDSQFSFRRNLLVSLVLVVAMPIGSALAGIEGVLWGSVVARASALAALWPEARRRGFLRLWRELVAVPYLAAGYLVGTTFSSWLPAPADLIQGVRQLWASAAGLASSVSSVIL